MKRTLFLIVVSLLLTGCVAFPVYDDGYDYPYYSPHPYGYGYVNPGVNVFFSGGHGGHSFHGGRGSHGGQGFRSGYGFYRGGHGFRGGR